MTIILPDEFLLEVKRFNLHKTSQNKVRIMQKKNVVFLKFHNPMSGEVIETLISKEDFDRTQFMNWEPIAVPATWNSEMEEMIKNKLEDGTTTQPNIRNNSIESRQPSA